MRSWLRLVAIASLLLVFAVGLSPSRAYAGTFVVNSTANGGDANMGDGICETATPGECTLRAAIEEANAAADLDTIVFNLGAGTPTINVGAGGLPDIISPVIIDGHTGGATRVELNGVGAGAGISGLTVSGANGSIIKGLVINRFASHGIRVNSNGAQILGNYIGTDSTGANALPNGTGGSTYDAGIYITGNDGTIIGGTGPGEGNLIAGNNMNGIYVGPGSTNTVIQGNLIGTNAANSATIGNGFYGVWNDGGLTTTIGGTTPEARNVIAKNGADGIGFHGVGPAFTGGVIQGNYIGVGTDGQTALGNVANGISAAGWHDLVIGPTAAQVANGTSNTTPGGDCTGACNVISANGFGAGGDDGILINREDTLRTRVVGNYIGTDVTGKLARPNEKMGILIHGGLDSTIGGSSPAERNVIASNGEDGIRLEERLLGVPSTAATGNMIRGNYIGTDVTGNAPLFNGFDGVAIYDSPDNFVGGTTGTTPSVRCAGDCNLLVSSRNGLTISGVRATNTLVQGNYVGLNLTGTTGLSGIGGILIEGAPSNVIGGSTSAARNVISGNTVQNLKIYQATSNGNRVEGNYIGTNAAGTASASTAPGVEVADSSGNIIGGASVSQGNVISGNSPDGVTVRLGATNTRIENNYIGTDFSGTAAVGNSRGVILTADGNTVVHNLISGNGDRGVLALFGATGNVIQSNYIGTQAGGVGNLGNSGAGVTLNASPGNTIGGLTPSEGNIIAYNGLDGIELIGGTGNAILSNAIFSNGELGIDLDGNGVTLNDAGDNDTGANNRQNFPTLVLTRLPSGQEVVGGALTSAPNATFRVELFGSAMCDASRNGEGQAFLTAVTVTTDGTGRANFTTSVAVSALAQHAMTATATDAANNTSEFSPCLGNDAWPVGGALPLTEIPGADPPTAQTTITQYLYRGNQSKWYKFRVEPGSRIVVTLSNLPTNYDLILYKDIAAAFNDLTAPAALARLTAEFPARAGGDDGGVYIGPDDAGVHIGPDDSGVHIGPDDAGVHIGPDDAGVHIGPDDSGVHIGPDDAGVHIGPDWFGTPGAVFNPADFAAHPDAFASAQTRSILAVSGLRGRTTERVEARTWDNFGDFYIRVQGHNGAFSTTQPFQLTVTQINEVCLGVTPPSFASTLVGEVGPDGGYKTLIVTDLGRLYEQLVTDDSTEAEKAQVAAAIQNLWDELNAFAALPKVGGQTVSGQADIRGKVINVGYYDKLHAPDGSRIVLTGDARVMQAHVSADAKPGCAAAKNYAAASIKQVIDNYRAHNPVEYIVIAGSDAVIPFFRHADRNSLGNERLFMPPMSDASASQAALRLGYVLSQDRYGAPYDLSFGPGGMPVVDLPVGRLVETPSDMVGMLTAFKATPGGVTPTNTAPLVTGYDFVSDAAARVKAELERGLGQTNSAFSRLVQPGEDMPNAPSAWSATELRNAIIENRSDLIFLAGHSSDGRLLAADYRTRVSARELVESSANLQNAIIFSTGCHTAYNTVDADSVPGLTMWPDWAQAMARKQATLIAGTGYQYGDFFLTEYSERLYLEFAKQLKVGEGPVAVGKALVAAKQAYLAGLAELDPLHEKTVLQTTLYGLPMLSVNLPYDRHPAPVPDSIVDTTTPAPSGPGETLGLTYAEVGVTPQLTLHSQTLTDTTDPAHPVLYTAWYPEGSGGVAVMPGEPILPLEMRDVSVPDRTLRGVVFLGGAYKPYTTPQGSTSILPLVSLPTTELRGTYPAFRADVLFPRQMWHVNYFDALGTSSGVTRLAVTPAQYISAEPGAATGTLRLFEQMRFGLYYSANTATYGGNTPALAAPPTIEQVEATAANGTVQFKVRVIGDPSAGLQDVWVTYTQACDAPYACTGAWQSLRLVPSASDSTLWVTPAGEVVPTHIRFIVQAVNGVGLVSLATNSGLYYPVPTPGPASTPAPSTLTLDLTPAPGATEAAGSYGARYTFTAHLRDAQGHGVAGQGVLFQIGSVQRQAVTQTDGSAQVKVTLLQPVGLTPVVATFGGSDAFDPAFDSRSFRITPQSTRLQMQPPTGSTPPQSGDESGFSLTLWDGDNQRLRDLPVLFSVSDGARSYRVVAPTNYLGQAYLGPVPLPAGQYTVQAAYGGAVGVGDATVAFEDERYASSTATAPLVITPEQATLTYVGAANVPAGAPFRPAAKVTDEKDSTPGDLKLAQVKFTVKNAAGAVVATRTARADFTGRAEADPLVLDAAAYSVELSLVADGYYTAPAVTAGLTAFGPVIDSLTAPLDPKAVGVAVAVSAQFHDLAAQEGHVATWYWGDGASSAGTVTEPSSAAASGAVAGSHVYTQPGVYTLKLVVKNVFAATAEKTYTYVVVYDPSGGFVTGGGWINSPAGAYVADPTVTSRANFGFVAKYQRGATVPTGNTEFQLKGGTLKFKSTSYEWLVVSGAKAQFKGEGAINGSGAYRFLLTAWDGKASGGGGIDKFRIRIWVKNADGSNGRLVYDNQMGAGDTADPTTALGGGSITVARN